MRLFDENEDKVGSSRTVAFSNRSLLIYARYNGRLISIEVSFGSIDPGLGVIDIDGDHCKGAIIIYHD